ERRVESVGTRAIRVTENNIASERNVAVRGDHVVSIGVQRDRIETQAESANVLRRMHRHRDGVDCRGRASSKHNVTGRKDVEGFGGDGRAVVELNHTYRIVLTNRDCATVGDELTRYRDVGAFGRQ